MIKKVLLILAAVLPFTAAAQKFGTVDLEAVFTSMPEVTAMNTQLTEASKRYETELQKLGEEVNKLYADFQTIVDDPNTPDAIKQRRMQEITDRQQKVEQFRATAQQDLSRQQEQLMAPIQARIQEAIKAVGADGGYTFILPNEPNLILYKGADVTDVTAVVKTKLGIK